MGRGKKHKVNSRGMMGRKWTTEVLVCLAPCLEPYHLDWVTSRDMTISTNFMIAASVVGYKGLDTAAK